LRPGLGLGLATYELGLGLGLGLRGRGLGLGLGLATMGLDYISAYLPWPLIDMHAPKLGYWSETVYRLVSSRPNLVCCTDGACTHAYGAAATIYLQYHASERPFQSYHTLHVFTNLAYLLSNTM